MLRVSFPRPSQPPSGSPQTQSRPIDGFTALESVVVLGILAFFALILLGIGKRSLAEGGLPNSVFDKPALESTPSEEAKAPEVPAADASKP